MRNNAFWAFTHPAYIGNGQYMCKCKKVFYGTNELYKHVFMFENSRIAEEILSARQYEKYLKDKGIRIK